MVDSDGGSAGEGDDVVVGEVLEGVLVHVPGDHDVRRLLQVVPRLQVVDRLHLFALLVDHLTMNKQRVNDCEFTND